MGSKSIAFGLNGRICNLAGTSWGKAMDLQSRWVKKRRICNHQRGETTDSQSQKQDLQPQYLGFAITAPRICNHNEGVCNHHNYRKHIHIQRSTRSTSGRTVLVRKTPQQRESKNTPTRSAATRHGGATASRLSASKTYQIAIWLQLSHINI